MIYSKWWKEDPTTKITLPSKDLIQIWWRNQELYRQAKAKRIQHHQTSSTTNAKGTSLSGKHKRRKGPTETNPPKIKKMVLGTYISIITLNVNGLNASTKRHRLWLPWWCSGWESACQCRGHGFEPWSGKIPHAVEQLGPWATTTEPVCLEPVLRNKRGRNSERPAHRDEEWPLLATTK